MNVLVIATHHGAFLTLQQLKQWKIDNVTVVIPQSQIDKYKTFDGEVFTNYMQNMKKFCGRKIPLYVSDDWKPNNKLRAAYNFIHTIGGTGKWVVLEAGSLLGAKHHTYPSTSTFGVVHARVHPKMKKLYRMLGQEESSDVICASSFFINMDDASMRVSYIDPTLVHRPDILFAQSFGTMWCIRYRQMVYKCFTVNFWMEAIRSKQEQGELVAYPYDFYMTYAKKVKKYLPETTYNNILANGTQTEWLAELVALDL